MEDLSTKTCLIYDYGLCTELALKLAEKFGKVYYFCHWQDAFPKSNKALIGSGLESEKVYRIHNFWDYVDEVDLIFFPDTYCQDIVEFLRDNDYRVFGAGMAEQLENNRWYGRTIQKEIGLPYQNTVKVEGLKELREALVGEVNKFIKLNNFRGDIESFAHKDYESSKVYLDYLANVLGPRQNLIEFIIEDKIEGIEPGYDGFVVDGKYPNYGMYGYEMKGTGYIGKICQYEEIPEPVKLVNDKLSFIFEQLSTRSFFSTEIRVDEKGTGYLIDYTLRSPMPVPTAIHLEIWENLAEFIWEASEGNLIDLIPKAKYGAGVSLDSEWAQNNWLEVSFPEEIRPYVKFRRFMKHKNKYYAVPGFTSICSVIGLGNTPEEAIEQVKERVELVQGFELDKETGGLDNVIKEIEEGKNYGLEF